MYPFGKKGTIKTIMKEEKNMKYRCPCCGYYTFSDNEIGSWGDICEVCFWEIDLLAITSDTSSGANHGLTLNTARNNFIKFGACTELMVKNVRRPYPNELCADE